MEENDLNEKDFVHSYYIIINKEPKTHVIMKPDRCADLPVEEQDPTVVAHIMMHDGPEGNRIQISLSNVTPIDCDAKPDFQLYDVSLFLFFR